MTIDELIEELQMYKTSLSELASGDTPIHVVYYDHHIEMYSKKELKEVQIERLGAKPVLLLISGRKPFAK